MKILMTKECVQFDYYIGFMFWSLYVVLRLGKGTFIFIFWIPLFWMRKANNDLNGGGEGLLLVSIGFRGREKFVRLGHGKGPSTAARQARGPSATARQAVSPSESNASRERAERERERESFIIWMHVQVSYWRGKYICIEGGGGGAGDAAKGMGKIANLPLSLRPSLGNWFFALECVCVNKTRLVVYLLHM